MQAAWKPGFSSLHKADAQLVADEIASIGDSATPEQILDKARNPNTELHKCFEWDNEKAADAYRLQQARQVVCHLVIKETVAENRPPIRFFFKTESGGGYQPTQIILQDQDKHQELVASVMRDLIAIRNKYKNLAEFDSVFSAIDELALGKAS